jgi:signal transduction histidine kinase/CheY-like chemotaxis protein
MRVRKKKTETDSSGRGVARAALEGASREELLQEAVWALAREGNADRIGVWLKAQPGMGPQGEVPAGFHGLVWDRENAETPKEWTNLSVEPPLPEELLFRGKSVEQDLEDTPDQPIIGALVELRRALWIPIEREAQLKGVILAGTKRKQLVFSRARAESIAAELALALGIEEEQRNARPRSADLSIIRRLLETQATGASVETLLSNLADSCTDKAENGNGLGAEFVVIGVLPDQRGEFNGIDRVEFRWRSGSEVWTRAIESEPLASIWRRAMQGRRVIGSEPPIGWTHGPVARILAFPLESEGRLLGTLVAGLPGGAASLATLERLELRAAMAASALRHRRRKEEESQLMVWQQVLLDSIRQPLLLLDEFGNIAASSRGAKELTGQASKAAERDPRNPERVGASPPVHGHFAELFSGRDRRLVQTWLRKALEPGSAGPVNPDESPQAELHNGVGVRLRLGAQARGQATAILLEPVAARESTRPADQAETELQNVIEWLEEGVVLFDAQENVRAMNARFEQIVGLAPEESGKIKTLEGLIGRLEGHATDPPRFAKHWRELARRIEGGVREELQMARPAPRILERSARPVLDSAGRRLGRVEIYRDLTAQRVFQSKLLQTEKLAALGQMVSGIAHELSNPLTTILGYAQRLLTGQDASERTEEVRQIYQEAERASKILRQLLLNARETLPERRLVSLNHIAQRAMELQRFSLAAEKIRVEIDLDQTLPFVHGDPGQLQQVLMNLMGNAQQALEQQGRGGTIRIRTKRIRERRVLLEVEDDGPGIPQAIQARIFDPFFTTKPAGVGTGLGLAIVLSVVREHGGQVHVSSPPKGGAAFRIELPAASEALQEFTEAVMATGRENPHATAFETAKGACVLVVEDEPTVARLIADVLEDEGMHVDVLLDGRAALDLAARNSYDLVICDMKMPGLDGQHFYKSLERAKNPLRERFLFVTGDIVAAQTREFLERNHLPHVAKPFRVEELTEKVHGVLQAKVSGALSTAGVSRKKVARNG